MIKLYTLSIISLVAAISNAQINLYNINNSNDNNNIIDNNNNGQHTHKLALHNHKTINSRYTNHATANISNRRLKNRNNNVELSKREDVAKPNKRNKRDTTKIGDDIAIAMTEDYDRKYDNGNKRAQRKKNELVAVSGNEVESGDKRRHKDKKKNEEESNKVEADSVEIETSKKKKKEQTSQHTAAQSTKKHTLTTAAGTTTNEHQKKQKRGANNEMINIFRNRISNINGSKQYKEDIAGGMSLDYTIPSDMSMGKHAKQTKRHSKSKIKSVKSKVDKRPTMSPSLESSSITPTLESSSPTPTSTSSESPTPTSTKDDESCELYPDQDPTEVCPPDMYCKVDCKLKTLPWFGVCTTIPDYCTEEYKPVCGCDYITEYGNACEAEAMGMNVAYVGKCDVNTKPPISSSPTNAPSHGPSSSPTTKASVGPTTSPSKEVSFCFGLDSSLYLLT